MPLIIALSQNWIIDNLLYNFMDEVERTKGIMFYLTALLGIVIMKKI